MKKFVSLLLAMMMVIAMAAGAMAEENPKTYTITIANAQTGYTYEAYQVFAGDLMVDTENNNTVLSNIIWGTGVNGAELLKELTKIEAFKDCTDAASVAEVLGKDTTKDNAVAKAFAAVAGKHLATVAGSGNDKIAGLAAGYYLIKNSAVAADGAYTRFMLEVVKDVTVNHKGNAPSSDKKVKDTDDSTGVTTDWQDSADWDIGDEVPFKLSATLPSNYDDYKTYQLTFHDKQSAGLTFNAGSVKVYVAGVEITAGYEVVTKDLTDGCTFEVKFANLKNVADAKAGSVITVEYTATLNEGAVIGAAGNPNTSYITYSNNPNWDGDGDKEPTGKTPDDTVIVFTYQTIVNKTDGEKALSGAEFTLEKKLANGTWKVIEVVKNDAGTTFTFKGLDDGFYRLTETVTPAGYNSIEPIYFKVEATHTNDDAVEEALKLTALTATVTDKDGNALTDTTTGLITFKPVLKDGSLSTDVVNKHGATLPETGGMGTTMMYIGGGLLVAFAVIMLATKRRMNAAE